MNEYKNILNRAAKLCSNGEKCSFDIREKMLSWGLDGEDADKAIAYLVENKFIDDERFARFYSRDKLRFNKWGRIKIAYALRQKKIESSIINLVLQELDQQVYEDTLDQIIEGKIRSVGAIKTAANKAKVLRFAAQRGFTSEEIFASIQRQNMNNGDL